MSWWPFAFRQVPTVTTGSTAPAVPVPSSPIEDQVALVIAEGQGCGYGSWAPDGSWCRILCDNDSLHPTTERFDKCDCRESAKAILARYSVVALI